MDVKRAIKLLKQKSKEAVYIASFPYNNNEYIPWRRNIEYILESAFGFSSTEYKRVADVHVETKGTRAVLQRAYVRLIHRIQLEVNSIIQNHEILGIEEKPVVQEEKGYLESPIQLFDAMQLHPKVAEASRSCFVTGNYREATLNAFISLINCVKEITGLDLDGDDLMNKVFSFDYDKDLKKITKYPIIHINELKNSTDRSEQQGFMFLYKGAAGAIRNPKAHKIIPQSNPLQTLEYLGFASLLMRILEKSTTRKTKSTKINEEIFISRCKESGHEKAIYLHSKAKGLEESRFVNGDFINWGVSGYSYRIPWKGCINGGTIFTAFSNGKLQIWPDIILRKSSAEAGNKYLGKLRSIPRLAREFSSVSKHKYPTISTERMSEPEIDTFIEAIKELGINLDEISKETSS